MPFGKCNQCIHCRSTYFFSFNEWRNDQEKSAYFTKDEKLQEDRMPEHAVLHETWKCCRHAPVNHRLLKRCEEGEFLTDAMFPKLSAQDVWLGECGCGEFELDPDSLLDEDE